MSLEEDERRRIEDIKAEEKEKAEVRSVVCHEVKHGAYS